MDTDASTDKHNTIPLGTDWIAFRVKYSLTKKMVADLFGISPRTVSRYEDEVTRPSGPVVILAHLLFTKPDLAIECMEMDGVKYKLCN